MNAAIIIGAGPTGLVAARALAERDYQVTIIEKDASEPPIHPEPDPSWHVGHAPQLAQSHIIGSRAATLLRDRLPDVFAAITAARAPVISLLDAVPPALRTGNDPRDADLIVLGCRRHVFDAVLRRTILDDTRITLQHGRVSGLQLDDAGRLQGVTVDGQCHHAELVLDASGRRTRAASWLTNIGIASPADRIESAEITYFTRYYMLTGRPSGRPVNTGFGPGAINDFYTGVLFIGDDRTFSVSIGVDPQDEHLMTGLRNEKVFDAIAAATPTLAPWTNPSVSTAISSVRIMGALDNTIRGFAADPPLPGFYSIGDAAGTTNPSYGRGLSLGIASALDVADRISPSVPIDKNQAAQIGTAVATIIEPWFDDAVARDRARTQTWRATTTDLGAGLVDVLDPKIYAAAVVDPIVCRALLRVLMTLEKPDSLESVCLQNRIDRACGANNSFRPPQMPGRDTIDRILAEFERDWAEEKA